MRTRCAITCTRLVRRRGLQLALEAPPALPPVLAQPDRMRQVLINLLDNAVKYCRPGDTIVVQLVAEPGGARCVVRDSGPGVAAQQLPRLAERLYRVRTDVPGNGLGLALVSEILRQHGASLVIESSAEPPQTGTALSWVLPYSRAGGAGG